jgi:hypothetical protein
LLLSPAEAKGACEKGEVVTMRRKIARFALGVFALLALALGASYCSDSYSAPTQPPSNITPPPGATPTPIGY